jgi:hypothetical protein
MYIYILCIYIYIYILSIYILSIYIYIYENTIATEITEKGCRHGESLTTIAFHTQLTCTSHRSPFSRDRLVLESELVTQSSAVAGLHVLLAHGSNGRAMRCCADTEIIRTHQRSIKYHSNTSSTAQGGGGSFKNRKPIGEIGCCESRMSERIH